MAMQSSAEAEGATLTQLIVFRVGDEEFGVAIDQACEIIKAGTITPVPGSPAFIRGLINVRGEIVATIDLRARFSMRNPGSLKSKHIVITRQQDTLFGLMVDEVTEVLRVSKSEIKNAPRLVTNTYDEYVMGVLPVGNRLIVVLDLACVLSEDEMARLRDLHRDSEEARGWTRQDATSAAPSEESPRAAEPRRESPDPIPGRPVAAMREEQATCEF